MTLDEGEIRRVQQEEDELRSHLIANLDGLHVRMRSMVADLGVRETTGPVAAENGAKLVAEYAAYLGRALRPWSRHEVGPLLEMIKNKEQT